MAEKKDIWDIFRAISGIIAIIVIPVALALIANMYSKSQKNAELKLQYIQLAVRILEQEPTKENARTREWAVELINYHSDIPLQEKTKKALVDTTIIAAPLGVTAVELTRLARELGVTRVALRSFFRILEDKEIPLEDLDDTLRDIARSYKDLQSKLASVQEEDDPALTNLWKNAQTALEKGEFEKAELLLSQLSEKYLEAVTADKHGAERNLRRAAASLSALGDLKTTHFQYADAAHNFTKAAQLLPEGANGELAEYLTKAGSALKNAGALSDAVDPLRKALEIREKYFGKKHPDTAVSLNNLAEVYRSQGRYEEAIPLIQRALEIQDRALGPEHPNTAVSLNNLAEVYRSQGRYEEAITLIQRALGIQERVLGPEHPDVAISLNNLAKLFKAQGRIEDAVELCQRASAVLEKTMGPEHPTTIVVQQQCNKYRTSEEKNPND